mmetsp:Transcript_117599/g.333264  ORF Transcript_117599/g.333264 Transcript_117599/m.333264 type:complete len:210 (-) Transcript_117599:771-1400(-)
MPMVSCRCLSATSALLCAVSVAACSFPRSILSLASCLRKSSICSTLPSTASFRAGAGGCFHDSCLGSGPRVRSACSISWASASSAFVRSNSSSVCARSFRPSSASAPTRNKASRSFPVSECIDTLSFSNRRSVMSDCIESPWFAAHCSISTFATFASASTVFMKPCWVHKTWTTRCKSLDLVGSKWPPAVSSASSNSLQCFRSATSWSL